MWKKIFLASSTFALIVSLGIMSGRSSSAYAQGVTPSPSATDDGDTTVTMEITGVIDTITQQSPSVWIIMLDDGTRVVVNPDTQGFDPNSFHEGDSITLTVALDDGDSDNVVAKIITTGLATPAATQAPTAAPTQAPTQAPTVAPTAAGTEAACGSGNTQPVAQRLADAFGVSYGEIMGWHCQGFGFGEIAKAYLLAKKTGKSASDYFGMKKGGQGWGNIIKDANKNCDPNTTCISHKDLSMGQAIKGNSGKPTKAADSGAQTGGKGKGGNGGGKGKGGNGGGKGH